MRTKHWLAQLACGALLMTASVKGWTALLPNPPSGTAFSTKQMLLGDHATSVVDTGGAGVPVVLIHGLAADHQMWNEVIAQLAPRHRVIAYDVRGHGAAAGAAKPYSVPVFAADLKGLLDSLQIQQAHIYGMSMGGAIAQQFAVSYPERIKSLALIATFSKAQPGFALRGQSAVKDGIDAQIAPTLTRWFTPAALAVNGPGVQYARASVLNVQPEDWLASWTSLSTVAFFPQLSSIKVPTKVIAGELDVSCPPELMKNDIAAQIPGAKFVIIPGASHMVTLVKAKELAVVLLDGN